MKKVISLFVLIIGFSCFYQASAQYYKTALGLRLGASNGITAKHFISETSALEGLLYFRWEGFAVTGLYELNGNAFDTDGLNWYFGGGGHIGFWDNDRPPWHDPDNDSEVFIGGDLILGLEYTFEEIPLNLALDWKPGFNIIGDQSFWADDVALSVRFAFR